MDLERDFLISTIAQTLVYGVFAGWLESDSSGDYNWVDAEHELAMPVIADLLHEVSGPAMVRGAELDKHLRAVARVLNWTDRDEFSLAFGARAIEYFYEPFLARSTRNCVTGSASGTRPERLLTTRCAGSNGTCVTTWGSKTVSPTKA